MIRQLDLRTRPARDVRTEVPRAELDVDAALDAVRPVCADVRQRGRAGVLDATERFDGVRLAAARVPAEALEKALVDLDGEVRAALEEAIRRSRIVHRAQLPSDVTTEVAPGGTVTERWVPVGRVGLYAPAGLAPLPSSVLMNAVPAQVAGVESIAVASPPQRDTGLPDPTVLATCALLGITEFYAVGGAQAIAMFGYGTDECEPVDFVAGPGNPYVTAAKRHLKGVIGTDAEAGPSEVLVLADDSADPRYVAVDLMAQAEHAETSAVVLVTDSAQLCDAVRAELAERVPATPKRAVVERSLADQSALVLVRDLEQGLAVTDAWAAEHVEVLTRDARAVAARISNAGAIFVGAYSPVPLGDYLAGSNHVLPTGGTARHTAGLSVQSFLRGIHVVEYSEHALAEVADHIDALGTAETLHAHVAAVRERSAR
ncbi:MAG: histidinol dehydrogenase [Streptosporangiales bacterium]|nr:histidinol dehydrogenase [Streptosporangiales bacterium]